MSTLHELKIVTHATFDTRADNTRKFNHDARLPLIVREKKENCLENSLSTLKEYPGTSCMVMTWMASAIVLGVAIALSFSDSESDQKKGILLGGISLASIFCSTGLWMACYPDPAEQ